MRLLVLVPSLLQILSSTRRVKAYPAYDKSPLSPRSSTSSSSQKFPLVTGLQKVPDDDHPYLDPLPTNDRGPCPGLNALANRKLFTRFSSVFFSLMLCLQIHRWVYSSQWDRYAVSVS